MNLFRNWILNICLICVEECDYMVNYLMIVPERLLMKDPSTHLCIFREKASHRDQTIYGNMVHVADVWLTRTQGNLIFDGTRFTKYENWCYRMPKWFLAQWFLDKLLPESSLIKLHFFFRQVSLIFSDLYHCNHTW